VNPRSHTKEELRMKQSTELHADRQLLDLEELFSEQESERDAHASGPKDESPPLPSPSLRYRPFERLAAQLRSN
jgi:hypothetical protein